MVSAENIEIIKKAGFVRALLPASMGGDERDLTDYCAGIRLLTKSCTATGWVTGVNNVHPLGVLHFKPEVQKEVWANGVDTVIASSGSPSIKATLVDGGILVNGKGRWASGCDNADWSMVGVKVPNLADAQYPERKYIDYMFMVKREDYEIEDTWYSTGQRGSGSKDLVFKDHFVPWSWLERQDSQVFLLSKGIGTVKNDWYSKIPFSLIFSVFLPAVSLGCSDGMIEQYMKRQRSRKNAYTGSQGILNPTGYIRLAESEHELDAISVYYTDLLNRIQQIGTDGRRVGETEFMELHSKLAFVADRCVKLNQRLFEGAGSSAIADFNPMQRYWRDGQTVRLHTGMDLDSFMQRFGRSLIGLMPTPDV
jgi:3-hydroxy-9,10-secoandrosta-1,3,5(10)-triene-9,17-dione monooxygenase